MNSFTSEFRRELLSLQVTKPCCKRSMLMGLLINAECGIGGSVYIRLTDDASASLAVKYLAEIMGRETVPAAANCYGRTAYEILVSSEKLEGSLAALSDAEHISEEPDFFRCQRCREAFCAGVMLSAGSVCNPEKESRAEIRINDPARASKLSAFFAAAGLLPSLSQRNGTSALLFKKSEDTEALLALCGAKNAAMSMMQYKLVRELRGDINRRSNCEINNIVRTAGAAAQQLEAIHTLRADGKLASLSDELRETAELREANPEASMSELAAMHNPPISKSGLNHRLEKLIAAAQN